MFISHMVVSQEKREALLLTSNYKEANTTIEEIHSIQLIDLRKMEVIDNCDLDTNEHALSIERFEKDNIEMYVVGTAYSKSNKIEPTLGRLIIITTKDNKIEIIYSVTVNGAVYSMKTYMKDYLTASIQKQLKIYKYERSIINDEFKMSLQLITSIDVKLIGLYIKTYEDRILVGDLMKNISVDHFVPNSNVKNSLNEVCRDFYVS